MALMREFRTPADFWSGMVEPDFADCQANKADLRAAFHAAISLFHMHDWIWKMHGDAVKALFTYRDRDRRTNPVRGARSFANALEQQCPDFGRIRGIANAAKHLTTEIRPVDNAARHAADTAIHVPGAGRGGYGVGAGYGTPGGSYAGQPHVMLAGANGKDMEFFEVAKAVREMWIGLRASTDGGEVAPLCFWRSHTNKAGCTHAACRMGLEGLVSKRRDRPYQAGRSKHWVKVKNRKHPAMSRVMDAFA
jgi:hypothetical protein